MFGPYLLQCVKCVMTNVAALIQMDLIVGSDNGTASSTDILNSADTMTTRKLKKSETEHLLNRLVHDQWLSEVKHSDSHRMSECNLG